MQAWRNLSISTKVVLAFALVFAATVGLGLFGLSQTAAVNAKAADIRNNWLPSTAGLGTLLAAIKESRLREARVVMSAEVNNVDVLTGDIEGMRQAQAAVNKAYADYQPMITAGTEDERLMRQFVQAWAKMNTSVGQIADLARRGDIEAVTRLYRGEDRANYDEAVGLVVADVDFNATQGKAAAEAGAATYDASRLLTFGALVLCAALCFGAGLALSRGVAAPIRLIATAVDRLASGDLQVTVVGVDRKDEVGLLARALEVFKRNGIEAKRLSAEREAAQAARERRQDAMDQHTKEFGGAITGIMGSLTASAETLRRASESMADAARSVHEQASG
ncbi:MAG TPA: MCP four helix bundle domain-containing protein, partial [Rhodopila sp.]